MQNKTAKIIVRFTITIILISFIILLINYFSIVFFLQSQFSSDDPSRSVERIANELEEKNYTLSYKNQSYLHNNSLWVQAIDKDGNEFFSMYKPSEIPIKYSLGDIANISKNYLKDYPVYLWKNNENIIILGYPKNSIVKYNWSTSIKTISNIPFFLLILLLFNIVATILLATVLGRRLMIPLKHIIDGVFSLKNEKEIHLQEKGLYKDLSQSVNETSLKLVEKNIAIKKRENAIANWIAGISHDIRTPLSMILGYSGVLEEDMTLLDETRLQAKIITENALSLKELVSDLNLATSLQYNMQPLTLRTVRLSNIARKAMANCINGGILHNCTNEIIVEDENVTALIDDTLLVRAVTNLITNSAKHNKKGCHITIIIPQLPCDLDYSSIIIKDTGCGIPKDKIKELNEKNSFQVSINKTHGLGFIIVKNIIEAHHGKVIIESKEEQGTVVLLKLLK
ncbi:HAMP domain-containing histidine kinase [Clostridium sp. P21]|uniref:histidine kinase n=1 Tax=Clostridium muellerianum TaxID=2716538 RepID=A0A7Y0EJ08_9CLOT|nr:HAMP domain-containing sensor histidine kinase [Clostridium muellerianum]NMM64017.1 HAMP domain-containing histidine kinase [Clostridium muellerianum]